MVERIRQEVRKVGFWKNPAMRELLTKALVRDLDEAGICRPGASAIWPSGWWRWPRKTTRI